MLNYLAPEGELPFDVAVFTRDGCPFCVRAKGLLNDAGIEFEELLLNRDYTDQTLRAVSASITYPQVFIDGTLVGGSDELAEWLQQRDASKARNAA
jgi:glutaredoxin-like protein